MNCEWIILIVSIIGLVLGMLVGVATGFVVVNDLRKEILKRKSLKE